MIAGPTASGKTDLAFQIARIRPTRIISFDSMQVYKRMPIATQAPSDQGPYTTDLCQMIEPSQEYNAALFCKDAEILIDQAIKDQKIPLLVGGTGLYLRMLRDGLFEASELDSDPSQEVRKRLIEEAQVNGSSYLWERLKQIDALSASKIHFNDTRRLVRALEVCELTGKPMSEIKLKRQGLSSRYDFRVYFVYRSREALYERIDKRCEQMMQAGLLDEVRALRLIQLSKTAMMALGVREMNAHLNGELSLADALELLKKNTRNYAKRQLSWFRNERDVMTLDLDLSESLQRAAEDILAKEDL